MGTLKETIFTEVAPRKMLRDYVDAMWYSVVKTPHTLWLLPTTRSVLMTCKTPYGNGIVFVGPMSAAQPIVMQAGDIKVGAWLKPGRRYTFQPHTPSALRNSVVLGRNMADVIQKCESATTHMQDPLQKLECLQNLLEAIVAAHMIIRDAITDAFVGRARQSGGQTTVRDSLKDVTLSYRQASRRIKEYTGFTAKEFLQLERLRAATHDLDTSSLTVSAIAANHNYADHAHFARDFKAKVGTVPSVFAEHQAL